MTQKFVNNFRATVAQTFGAADNYLYLSSVAGLPTLGDGDYLLLTLFRKSGIEESGHEVIKVTAITDNMLTVQRAVEGAAASLFNVGDHVEARVTAKSLQDKADALHAHAITDVTGLQTALDSKQGTLVSGVSIKTINGESVLGSGDMEIKVGQPVTLSGNLTLYVTQSTILTITNYDSATTYSVSATGGTATINGDQITYTAGSQSGSFALSITAGEALRSVAITVQPASVSAPTITSPTNGQTGLGQAPTFTSSAFSTIGVSDTFLNADHEVRTGPNGTGTLIASSYANTSSETSWTMPGSLLAPATTYYYRKPAPWHRSGRIGLVRSQLHDCRDFGGLIGTQGGQGFGVGVCVDSSRLTALGLSEMTGTTDKTHANYGNYQHTNGGISVYRPKFFYRIGHPSSPRYATYGANAVDIVGIETFANEAAANAAGYAMSRSFKKRRGRSRWLFPRQVSGLKRRHHVLQIHRQR